MNKAIFAVLHLAAAGQLLFVKPAHGLTFNFNWTSDAPDLEILPFSGEERGPVTAKGTLDINRLPGESFTFQDISNVNILVTQPVPRRSSVYN